MPRQIHRKSTPHTREILYRQLAAIARDALTRNGQSQAKPRAIIATLRERGKHFLRIPRWQATAVVLHNDQNTLPLRIRCQGDGGMRACKLQRVIEQIGQRGE